MVYQSQPSYSDFHGKILDRPIDEPGRRLRVVHIGAGISGITNAIRLPQKLGDDLDFQIYEKNTGVGGTWLENKYPGVGCDIPSVSYQWSFEDNPNWSSYYAPGKEILQYIEHVATKYKTLKYMKFQHTVVGAFWDEGAGQWQLKIRDLQQDKVFDDYADFLIFGYGLVNLWHWPDIKGLHDFKGPYMHSAAWDDSFDPTGKAIAIVGGGSSGIQILPVLQKSAKRIDHYMKTQNWCAPVGFGADELFKRNKVQEGNFDYSEEEKQRFREDPKFLHDYRLEVEEGLGRYMSPEGLTYGTDAQKQVFAAFVEHMNKKLETKPQILKVMLPDFPPGCRRLTPGPGYLEALCQPNVEFIPERISHVTETGIVTMDGQERNVDAIVWATGFNVDWQERFPTVGRYGRTLTDVMDPEPESYLGLFMDSIPNACLTLGPNAAPGGTTAIQTIETEVEFIVQVLKKMLLQKLKSICIKTTAVKQFTKHVNAVHKTLIYGQPCRSWLNRNNPYGRNVAYYGGNGLNLAVAVRNPKWEDFEYTYMDELEGNPMGWLGNGYVKSDFDGSSRVKHLLPESIDYPPIPGDIVDSTIAATTVGTINALVS